MIAFRPADADDARFLAEMLLEAVNWHPERHVIRGTGSLRLMSPSCPWAWWRHGGEGVWGGLCSARLWRLPRHTAAGSA
jgi:hypothetical protein